MNGLTENSAGAINHRSPTRRHPSARAQGDAVQRFLTVGPMPPPPGRHPAAFDRLMQARKPVSGHLRRFLSSPHPSDGSSGCIWRPKWPW